MILNYDGWCRRIDMNFRSKYPYLNTRIFKLGDYEYQLYLVNSVDDFYTINDDFNQNITFLTAPMKLVNSLPNSYASEIEQISDDKIPSGFEGYSLTINQLYTHILSIHPNVSVSKIKQVHERRLIIVVLSGSNDVSIIKAVEGTVIALKGPFFWEVQSGGEAALPFKTSDEVFNIAPSQSKNELNCHFIERDEKLWYENVDGIYDGSFKKSDLYFFDSTKTSCLVNFSKFNNANLRNHLLLYDVVYCILPLATEMSGFLKNQKIKRDDILHLVKLGRLKILNVQPESRLDYGFLNEVYQENPSSVVSRRALSALCALDLVEINKSYILNDPEIDCYIYPLLQEISKITNKNIKTVSNCLLWPKHALRNSLTALNQSGPMGVSNYGVNNPIIDMLPSKNKTEVEFEFIVNSDQIHLSHALDATYFPFFIDGEKYSDHPYAVMMGGMLNFFKTTNYNDLSHSIDVRNVELIRNPSLGLISIFDINDYIPVVEFEKDISSSIVRHGMSSLFSELSLLEYDKRIQRISEYNVEMEKLMKNKSSTKHVLDLGEDILGLFVPFLATGKKLLKTGAKKAIDKYPAMKKLSEVIEEKSSSDDEGKRNVTILSQVNRVAKLKHEYE